MAALEELSSFVLDYCEAHEQDIAGPGCRDVAMLLAASVLPDAAAKQAALYGFADAIGAIHAAGFDPRWNPRA